MKKIQSIEQLQKIMSNAVQAHQAGDFKKAQQGYERAIQYVPGDAQIRYLLGLLYGQQGFYPRAKQQLLQAVKAEPGNAEYLNHYGLALSECGEHTAAVSQLEKAVQISPELPGVLNNLGLAYRRLDKTGEAQQAFERALEQNPADCDAWVNLGELYEMRSMTVEAIATYQRALQAIPDDVIVTAKLAALLPIQSNIRRLQGLLDGILQRDPEDFDALLTKAKLALVQQGHQQAIDILSRLLERDSSNIALLAMRADAWRQLGDTEHARSDVMKGRKIDPNDIRLVVQQARLAGKDEYGQLDKDIQRLLSSNQLAPLERASLEFALARMMEKAGNPEEAFPLYEQANKTKRQTYHYDVQLDIDYMDAIRAGYQGAETQELSYPDMKSRPLFIVGLPRSGTSLVEQILDSHSQVKGLGELPMLKQAIMHTLELKDIRDYPKALQTATLDDLEAIRQFYIEESTFDPDGPRFQTDKMPFNLFYIGLIRQLFPDSPVIICQRQLEATAYSIYRILFDGEFGFAYSQREIALYCKAYDELSRFWLESVTTDQVFSMQYEALVTRPEPTIRNMLDYCGLVWEENCLDFHASKRPVTTASATQVRQQIYTNAMDEWKQSIPYLEEMYSIL